MANNKKKKQGVVEIPQDFSYENQDNTYVKAMQVNVNDFVKSRKVFDFYGAHSNCFKIDTLCISILEDPQDGYRSNYGACIFIENPGGFYDTPLSKVRVKLLQSNKEYIFTLVDVKDGHVWLRFGTENADDYYPYFVCSYSPKKPL